MYVKCGSCGVELGSTGFDITCPVCSAELNAVGQVLAYPNGQGEDYAGEDVDPDAEVTYD